MAGIYVHIPFCIRKCAYCDFVSFPTGGDFSPVERYLPLLKREIALFADGRDALPEDGFDTVFFGGGTPSLLTGAQMKDLLDCLRSRLPVREDAEITAECNPGTCTEESLAAYREAGVNRLSVGMQSSSDALLKRIGRIHTAEQFVSAVNAACAAGFRNVNADVMYGLPGQREEDYLDSLRLACSLPGITHVSAYSLILEEGTPLFERVAAGEETLPEEDAVYAMEKAGQAYLKENGFSRYEISNYAKEGFACRHNLNYWENGIYAGFGPAAHSALRTGSAWIRVCNPPDLDAYAKRLEKGVLPREEAETVPVREEMFECVMLGLRTVRGMDCGGFERRFGVPVQEVYPGAIRALSERGWLDGDAPFLRLNETGLDFHNAACLLFLEERENL